MARRDSELTAWVNVIYGCNEKCTYCVVPFTRGQEQSRRPDDIKREMLSLGEVRGGGRGTGLQYGAGSCLLVLGRVMKRVYVGGGLLALMKCCWWALWWLTSPTHPPTHPTNRYAPTTPNAHCCRLATRRLPC